MELYGSLLNISGSVTASAFTGSFIGDGSGLTGIQASGVTGLNLSQISNGDATASISTSGFTVNKNTQIQGNLSVTGALIANQYIVSSSVVYMTTSFASGSSAFGNDNNDVHQFTGSVQITGSISLNGQAIGTGKLDETTFQSYTSSNNSRVSSLETSSGSLNSFTSSINTTIKSKLDSDNVISGSIQVILTGTTGYDTFSSSISTSIAYVSSSISTTTSNLSSSIGGISSSFSTTTSNLSSSIGSVSSSVATTTSNLSSSIATTDLNQSNRLDSIEGKTGSYATTGSNLFKGTQTLSGSILPSLDNTYDLGSADYQWRDVYISSGSLYIDGTKVISSTSQELQITTDNGQSIKILESGTDSIILQTADGDIELKSNADGDILLDPTNGKIMLKGPVEILNGQKIQSSVGGTPVVFANDIVVSGSIDITGTIEGINLTDFSSSVNTRIGNLESSGGNINSFTSSANSRLNSLESTSSSLNSYTSSNDTRLSSIETTSGSLNSYTSSNNTRLSSIETTTSSILSVNSTQNSRLDSLETISGSILTTNTAQSGRLDSIEGKSGSYATTGSNIFQGDQTITGSLYISQNLIIAGSSSIQNISSSVLNISDNIITVNAINPSVRFGGLAVIDSGSSPQVSGSILFDSVNNQWLFVHQNQGTVTSSVLLMGPETYNNVGNETYITSNRIVKSTGIEHLTNSNISDDGTTVTILSNAVVNGTFSATGTTLVSGSSQINHNATTNYDANQHIDHTTVSISAGNGLSGGGDISTTRTLTLDTTSATFTSGVKSKMSADGVVSGSSQVSFTGITDKPTLVSGSSQITYGSLSSIPSGIVSGSSQITFGSISSIPGGLVSGSSQIDLTSTTNYSTGIKTRLNAEGVVSGSSQVTNIANSQLTNSSFNIGTTSISLGRASATQTLNGVSIDGNAATVTNGVYTSGDQSIGGGKTFTSNVTINGTVIGTDTTFGGAYRTFAFGTNSNGFNRIFAANDTSDGLYLNAATGRGIYFRVNGGGADVVSISSAGAATFTGTISASNFSGTSSGTNTGDVTETLATVTGRGNTTTTSMGIGSNSIPNGKLYVNGGSGTDVIAIQNTLNTGAYLVFADNVTPTWANAPRLGAINNDMVFKILDVERFRMASTGATFTTTISASNLSGTNTGDQTLSGLGGLSNNIDSEQTVGGRAYYFNSGAGRMNADPRWNESGYDADLGCLHLWSWTAAGAAYGRAGIAFYNDNAYQYLTTKSNTTGLFVNNSLIATAGSSPTFASVTGTITSSGSGDGNAPFRFSADYSGWMSHVAGTPGSNNGWGLFWAGNSGAQYGTNGASGPGDIWSNSGNPNEYVFVGNGTTAMSVYGNTGDVWIRGTTRVEGSMGVGVSPALKFHVRGSNEMVRFENTSTTSGQYAQLNMRAGSRNAYLWVANENTTSWAGAGGLNIYTEIGNMDFWTNAVQRVRIQTDGHMVPYVNNTYDLGSSSLGWRNVYTNDLHLSNMNKPEGNDVDGTNGNWTIQEGAEQLYIINNNNGKKFKINLTEII